MSKILSTLLLFSISASLVFAETIRNSEFIQVETAEPVYKEITKSIPYKECYDVTEQIQVECQNSASVDKNSLGLDTLIGVAAGAVIGSQIGKGNGRTAAQIVGGIAGGGVANSIRGGSTETCTKEVVRQHCENKTSYEKENRLIGYNNVGYYKNQKIVKFSEQKLQQIKLNVSISY